MKYQLKNLTGDPTSPNAELWVGRKLYATSKNGSNMLPLDAQETCFVSSKAMIELTTNYPTWVQVLDADGSEDLDVPYRKGPITLSATWQSIDLGRFAGKLQITNTSAANSIYFSLSGGTGLIGAGGVPPAATISAVLKSETITIDTVMDPIRYIYLLGSAAGELAYVLVD